MNNTKDELEIDELSREQILDLADAQGRKFGFLLATSPFDEETKNAFLSIIEKATLEQIAIILNFFEEEFLKAQNKDLNDWIKIQLENIKFEFDIEQEKLDIETIDKINKLEESF
ncbi:MAG: hypothetical protein ABH971_00180 [bacterium]